MKLSGSNTQGSKVSVIAVDISRALEGLAPWATVYVHREPDYCKPYSNVSKSSVARVQRAQNAMLGAREQS